MRKYLKGFLFVGVFLGFFVCGTAFADLISFDLSVGNAAIAGYPGPYASVTVDQTGDVADITVARYGNYLIGAAQAFGITPTSTVMLSNLDWTGGNGSTAFTLSSGQIDGFGSFTFVLDGFNGLSSAVSELRFTLTGSGWSSAADVLALNDDGYLAAAHIFINDGSGTTGYASTPIPAAVWLLGFGVVGLVGAKRRIS